MKISKNILISLAVLLIILQGRGLCDSLPDWDFNVIVSVSDSVFNTYGSLDIIKALLDEQFDSINNRYNSGNCFEGFYNFHVDTIQVYNCSPYAQANRPHPGYDYQLTLDYYSLSRANWLNPPANGILVLRKGSDQDDFFNEIMLPILTHEFAHSRGAIDIYGFAVLDYLNPVNASYYIPDSSIMMNPFHAKWDPYTVNLINMHGDKILEADDYYLSGYFPPGIKIQVRDLEGLPLTDAEINFYPHTWYNFSLSPLSILTGHTDSAGEFKFSSDIFVDLSSSNPMSLQHHITNTVILVEARWRDSKNYLWLALDRVQNAYFENPASLLNLELTLPVLSSGNYPLPQKFVLLQNYPNPFNSATNIDFYLTESADINLEIVNILGQTVSEIFSGYLKPGKYSYPFQPGNLGSGVYYYRLRDGDTVSSRKMLLLK